MRIDSHQHFWHYSPTEHTWMSAEMEVLKHDYLPEQLEPLLKSLDFDGCVTVQARQSLEETRWLLELADKHNFIKGVVGWVDLCSAKLPEQLELFTQNSNLVGVRHVLQDEADDEFMLRPDFLRGLSQLHRYGLVYDLLLFPRHLPIASRLVEQFPDQSFVLDHIAKPNIAGALISPWEDDFRALARYPNVACKLSGMVTEANWKSWKPVDLKRYLDVAAEAYGPHRLMIGSDWPVCTLAGEYSAVMQVVLYYVQQLSATEQAAVLGLNCARIYNIQS